MTVFITDSFSIDFSLLDITFQEENSFFEEDLIKQQSFPFKIPKERGFIPFFEFMSSHNSTDSNTYLEGILFRNDRYYEAELLILDIQDKIEAVIYYNFDKLTIFDTPLRSLPWPDINVGSDIYEFAKQTIAKDYPETLINFSKIYDPDRYSENDWGPYDGFINNNVDGDFERTVVEFFTLKFAKMNEMRPFIYIRGILKFVFDQIGYTITGDFVENEKISQALQYNENQIFHTNSDYKKTSDLSLSLNQSNISGYSPITVTYNEYKHTETISTEASYRIVAEIEGGFSVASEECQIKAYFKGQILSSALSRNTDSSNFRMKLEFDLHLDIGDSGEQLEIIVVASESTKNTIEGTVEIEGTQRPLYANTISLADLVPDVTVGKYITDVKKTFVLTSVFDEPTSNVEFNFFDSFIDNKPAIDLSMFGVHSPPRKLNRSIGYKIPFSNGEVLNLDRSGEFVTQANGFTERLIPIEPLPTIFLETIGNVKHQNGTSLLFFKSNPDALPLVIDGDINLTRLGFLDYFQRKWLFQNLNSEQYNQTITLPIHVSSKIDVDSKIWMYNNYFLIHNLKRININNLFEKLTFRFFKLKSYPQFNFVIDDGDGDTVYLPPTAHVSDSSINTTLITLFNTSLISNFLSGPYFTVDIYATGSSDPQGLELSYGWEIISSPDGNDSGSFIPQNADHSITRFTHSAFLNIEGEYHLKLTVVNTVGLSDSVEFIVAVSSAPDPDPSVGLIQLGFGNTFQASLNFTPANSTGQVIAQNVSVSFTTGTVTNLGSPVTQNVPNLTSGLNDFNVTLPNSSSNYWYIKIVVDGVESNDRPFPGGNMPFIVP